MAILKREEILQAADLQVEEVQVPEWGGSVLVRGMTGAERDQFESTAVERKGTTYHVNMQNVRARLAAACVVDEGGERMFSEKDVEALGKKSGAALQRVFDVAMRLSGMTPADVEELATNFN